MMDVFSFVPKEKQIGAGGVAIPPRAPGSSFDFIAYNKVNK